MMNHHQQITNEIRNARQSIKVAVSWLTDSSLIDELIDRAKKHVSVEIILSGDEWNILRFYTFRSLRNHGGKIWKCGPDRFDKPHFMHSKFCVIDECTIIEGSYNWTANAIQQWNNLRVARDVYRAEELLEDFKAMRSDSKDYFLGVSSPEDIMTKLEPLEKVSIQPYDPKRVNHEKKLKTANLVNNEAAVTLGDGRIVPKAKNISGRVETPNKPHRFYGGTPWKSFFRPEKHKDPYSQVSFQKYHIEKRFPFLKSEIKNNQLICRGMFQPEGCQAYDVEITLVPGHEPVVRVLNKTIKPSNDIHMYNDGTLCLFYPPDLNWKPNLKVAEYIVPWISEWIVFYEIFQVTGKWMGAEAPHEIY